MASYTATVPDGALDVLKQKLSLSTFPDEVVYKIRDIQRHADTNIA